MQRWMRVPCLGALLVCAWPSSSRADDSRDASEYNAIVHSAVSEYNAHNWQEALALFKQAHALQPNARTLRGIGNTAFELRHYAESLAALRASLDEKRKALTEKESAEVRSSIARIEHYVGNVRVVLSPAQATLAVDGVEV